MGKTACLFSIARYHVQNGTLRLRKRGAREAPEKYGAGVAIRRGQIQAYRRRSGAGREGAWPAPGC